MSQLRPFGSSKANIPRFRNTPASRSPPHDILVKGGSLTAASRKRHRSPSSTNPAVLHTERNPVTRAAEYMANVSTKLSSLLPEICSPKPNPAQLSTLPHIRQKARRTTSNQQQWTFRLWLSCVVHGHVVHRGGMLTTVAETLKQFIFSGPT